MIEGHSLRRHRDLGARHERKVVVSLLSAIGSAIGGREQREMMDLIKEDDVLGAGRAAAASYREAAADAHQLAAARLIAEELAASGSALSERARNTRRAAKLATDGVVVQLPMAKRARRLEPAAAPAPCNRLGRVGWLPAGRGRGCRRRRRSGGS